MRIGITLVFLSLAVLVVSCKKIEAVEYRGISNFRVGLKPKPVASADILFFNPNRVAGQLRSAEMEVWVDGKKAGSVIQQYDIPVKKQSEFTVPVEVVVSMKDIGLMSSLSTLLRGDALPVMLKGRVQIQVHGFPVSIPVEHTEKIKIVN